MGVTLKTLKAVSFFFVGTFIEHVEVKKETVVSVINKSTIKSITAKQSTVIMNKKG